MIGSASARYAGLAVGVGFLSGYAVTVIGVVADRTARATVLPGLSADDVSLLIDFEAFKQ